MKTSIEAANQARDEKVLNSLIRHNGVVITKRQMITDLIETGAILKISEKYKIKELSHTRFNRMNGYEQEEHERKRIESGKIPVYEIWNGNTFYEITRAEFEYGKTLIKFNI